MTEPHSALSGLSLSRSLLSPGSSGATVTPPVDEGTAIQSISPLPFLVCSLYDRENVLLRFLPGAFRRQGDVLGQGATFSVEKHTLKDIGRGMIDDLVSGDLAYSRWPSVAIKRIRRNPTQPSKTFETVERELIALKTLRGVKHVAQIIGVGWENSPVYKDSRLWPVLVLEFAEHGSLAELQRKSDSLAYEVKRKLCLDVASGLFSLREAGLFHGDLKSENVLVYNDPLDKYTAKLTDFGFISIDYHLCPAMKLSRHDSRQAALAVPGATELWSAPEFRERGPFTSMIARDVYSWGLLVLRVMVNGLNPFEFHRHWRQKRDVASSENETSAPKTQSRQAWKARFGLHRSFAGGAELDMAAFSRQVKLSDKPQIMAWIRDCISGEGGSTDIVRASSILCSVLNHCLDRDPTQRDLQQAVSSWDSPLQINKKTASLDVIKEVWTAIHFDSFRRLPLLVRKQFLQDFMSFRGIPSPFQPEEASSCPLNNMRLILAESYMKKTIASATSQLRFNLEDLKSTVQLLQHCASEGHTMAARLEVAVRDVALAQGDSLHSMPKLSSFKTESDLVRVHSSHNPSKKPLGVIVWQDGELVFADPRFPTDLRTLQSDLNSSNTHLSTKMTVQDALHEACSLGCLENVVYLVKDLKADVNGQDAFGESPLLKSSRIGAVRVVLFLLHSGADPVQRQPPKDSPLHWLWKFEDSEMASVASAMVAAGARPDAIAGSIATQHEEIGKGLFLEAGTALHRAIRRSRSATECLLRLGACSLVPSPDSPFHSPLSLACAMHLHDVPKPASSSIVAPSSVLQMLFEHAGSAYKPNSTHCGALRLRLPTIVLGASFFERVSLHGKNEGQCAIAVLDLLASCGEGLEDTSAGFSLLHLAVKTGDLDVVAYLLQKHGNYNVNLTFKYGDTFWQPPLLYAVRNGDKEMYKLLLRNGADPLQRFQTDYILGGTGIPLERVFWAGDTLGDFDRGRIRGARSTYLHVASAAGAGMIFAQDLLYRGVKVDSYDSNWESSLFLAILVCDFQVADRLIAAGASTEDLRDDRTMLGHLAEDGFMAPLASFEYIIDAQLKHGPRGCVGFMAVYKESRTWLHVLLDFWDNFRNPSWAESLLDLFVGKLPDKRLLNIQADMTAHTALTLAVESINVIAVRRLLEWGADPNTPNYEDGTPADIVLKMTHERMVKHKITYKTMQEASSQPEQLKDVMQQLQHLETIFRLLLRRGSKYVRGVPPYNDRRFEMTSRQSDEVNARRIALGVDLRTIVRTCSTDDGPMVEIVNEIAEDIVKTLGGRPLTKTEIDRRANEIVAAHLVRAPEPAYTARRLFRFEQFLARLFQDVGLEFDHREYGWRVRVSGIQSGGSIYMMSGPGDDAPLHLIKAEHQFCAVSLKSGVDSHDFRLPSDSDDDLTTPPDLRGGYKSSQPSVLEVPSRSLQTLQLQSSTVSRDEDFRRPSSPTTSLSSAGSDRDNSQAEDIRRGPVGVIRLKELIPKDGQSVIVGYGDELGLLFLEKPIPPGTRVMITTISRYTLSLTVSADFGPARSQRITDMPNNVYFSDDDR